MTAPERTVALERLRRDAIAARAEVARQYAWALTALGGQLGRTARARLAREAHELRLLEEAYRVTIAEIGLRLLGYRCSYPPPARTARAAA